MGFFDTKVQVKDQRTILNSRYIFPGSCIGNTPTFSLLPIATFPKALTPSEKEIAGDDLDKLKTVPPLPLSPHQAALAPLSARGW